MIFDFNLGLTESQYIQIRIETHVYIFYQYLFFFTLIKALIYHCIMLLLFQDSVTEINKGNAYKLNAI